MAKSKKEGKFFLFFFEIMQENVNLRFFWHKKLFRKCFLLKLCRFLNKKYKKIQKNKIKKNRNAQMKKNKLSFFLFLYFCFAKKILRKKNDEIMINHSLQNCFLKSVFRTLRSKMRKQNYP